MADDPNQLAFRDVLLPDELEGRVRTWAEAMLMKRSEAIRVLVEAGLSVIENDE